MRKHSRRELERQLRLFREFAKEVYDEDKGLDVWGKSEYTNIRTQAHMDNEDWSGWSGPET